VCQLIDAQKAVLTVGLEEVLPLPTRVFTVKVVRRVRGADGTVAAEVLFSEAEPVTLYKALKMVVVNLARISGFRLNTQRINPFHPPDATVAEALTHLEGRSPAALETALLDHIFSGSGDPELEMVYLKDNKVRCLFFCLLVCLFVCLFFCFFVWGR
jgi:hypothetical protein